MRYKLQGVKNKDIKGKFYANFKKTEDGYTMMRVHPKQDGTYDITTEQVEIEEDDETSWDKQ